MACTAVHTELRTCLNSQPFPQVSVSIVHRGDTEYSRGDGNKNIVSNLHPSSTSLCRLSRRKSRYETDNSVILPAQCPNRQHKCLQTPFRYAVLGLSYERLMFLRISLLIWSLFCSQSSSTPLSSPYDWDQLLTKGKEQMFVVKRKEMRIRKKI